MVIRIRFICLIFITLPLCSVCAQGVPQIDSLDQWLSKFKELRVEGISSDGKWVAVKKMSAFKDGSLEILSTYKSFVPIKLPGTSRVVFLKNSKLLSYGNGNVSLHDLRKGNVKSYEKIKQYNVLNNRKEYVVLDSTSHLSLYNLDGERISYIDRVKRYISDENEIIYAEQNSEGSSLVLKMVGNQVTTVYSTAHIIERMELSEFKTYFLIFEKMKLSDLRRVVVIDKETDAVCYPLGSGFTRQDYSTVKEAKGRELAIIKVVNQKRNEPSYLDMYYSNDQDLKSVMMRKTSAEEYWLWNNKTKNAEKFNLAVNRSICDIGSTTQFLNFNGNELRDYTHHRPLLNMSLYNIETKQNFFIGTIEPELAASEDGRYLLYRLEDESWEILDSSTKQRTAILNRAIRNPVFTIDNSFIFFESDNGLLQYNIKNGHFTPLTIAGGMRVRIVNSEKSYLIIGYNIYRSTIMQDKPLIVEAQDPLAGKVSYLLIENSKVIRTVLRSENQVSFFLYSDQLDRYCWLEENYNLPPIVKISDGNGKSKEIFGIYDDKEAKTIKQKIITYGLSSGAKLKGLLYYPQHFDPSRKYPMIVHIYQIQSSNNKNFLRASYDALGFNIRILLEKGYFVYLPDLITDERGPGISGLDCINRALDAVRDIPNIDFSKLGLIGHSFGGYLTNFISTRSDRFAAYISGSGVSDIIQSYYSLNRNFPGPHYWQLETGQYHILSSFADNKKIFFDNNPIYNADNLCAPILLWTGKADENVVPENTMSLYLSFKRYKKDVIALLYDKSGHTLTDITEKKDFNRRALDWWDYFLKNKNDISWINKQMKKGCY